MSIIISFKIFSFLDFQNSLNSSRQHLTTGEFQNNRTLQRWNFQYKGTNTITIKPQLLMEISGFYTTTSLSGTSRIRPYGGLNWGMQKKWGASIVRFNVIDIFNSIKSTATVNILGYHIRNGYDFSQRTLKVSYGSISITTCKS